MSKKYICSFCARAFSRSEHKLRHERSHTQTKPFQCVKCKTSFVRRDLLQRHLRNVHKLLQHDSSMAISKCLNNSLSNENSSSIITRSPINSSSVSEVEITSASQAELSGSSQAASPSSITPPTRTITIPSTTNSSSTSSTISTSHTSPCSNSPKVLSSCIPMGVSNNTSNDNMIQLLTLSKSHQFLQSNLESHLPTLFFIYGSTPLSNTIPFHDDLIYSILSFVSINTNVKDCVSLFNKSWFQLNQHVLLTKLQSLFLLSKVYLDNYSTLKELLMPIDVIFGELDVVFTKYLEDTTNIKDDALIHLVFHLQSTYCFTFNRSSTTSYQIILKSSLNVETPNKKLTDWLDQLSKNSLNLPNDQLSILLNVLFMELQTVNNGSYLNKFQLHNSIIMFNKFYISKFIQASTLNIDPSSSDQLDNLFKISKRHILLNVPQSFQDLIIDYVLIPKSENHIDLLKLTLGEFLHWNGLSVDKFDSIDSIKEIQTINNNLGLVSYPLLFLGCFPLKSLKLSNDNMELLQSLKDVVLTVLMIVFKLIKQDVDSNFLDSNVIMKGIIYLIYENTTMVKFDESTYDKTLIIDKLFLILRNWCDFCSIQVDFNRLRNQTMIIQSPIESPNLNGGFNNNNIDDFNKIKLPPLQMITNMNRLPSISIENYKY